MKTESQTMLMTPLLAIKSNYEELLDALYFDSQILLKWFDTNYFKLNADKCKLLVSNKEEDFSLDIAGDTVKCERSAKLLGIKIDNQLTFNEHISRICKTVSLKLHALARVSYFTSQDKLRLLMKAFIESQFSYRSLVWMFQTWDLVPKDIKESNSLIEFKRKIKLWKPRGCTCRMCKVYIFFFFN